MIVLTERAGLIGRKLPSHQSIWEERTSVLLPASGPHLEQNLLIDPIGVLFGIWILKSGASSPQLGQNLLIDPTGVLLGRWILKSSGLS